MSYLSQDKLVVLGAAGAYRLQYDAVGPDHGTYPQRLWV